MSQFFYVSLCAASNEAIPPVTMEAPLISYEHPAEISVPLTDTAVDTTVHFVVSRHSGAGASGLSNSGSVTQVHLSIDKPSCSCTSIMLDKDNYQLGETGVIHVHFEIGPFLGLKVIDLVAHATRFGQHQQQQIGNIQLVIQIPIVITVEPPHLEWGPQDGDMVKFMTFTVVDPKILLTHYDLSDSTFAVVPEQCVRTPTKVVLAIRRIDINHKFLCSVHMHAKVSESHEREGIGYLVSDQP